MVGTSFPYLEFLPRPGQARAVQIELDPARVGLRYPVEVGLVGDSRRILEALLPRLTAKTERGFLERAQAGMKDWWALMEERGTREIRIVSLAMRYGFGRERPVFTAGEDL